MGFYTSTSTMSKKIVPLIVIESSLYEVEVDGTSEENGELHIITSDGIIGINQQVRSLDSFDLPLNTPMLLNSSSLFIKGVEQVPQSKNEVERSSFSIEKLEIIKEDGELPFFVPITFVIWNSTLASKRT